MNHRDHKDHREIKIDNELTGRIIAAAIEVHRYLGPGLLESAYEECMTYELAQHQIPFERQKALPLIYKNVKLDCGFRLDFLVAQSIIVELKAVEGILPVHITQILTYLKLAKCKLGLILNFNVPRLQLGIKRIIL